DQYHVSIISLFPLPSFSGLYPFHPTLLPFPTRRSSDLCHLRVSRFDAEDAVQGNDAPTVELEGVMAVPARFGVPVAEHVEVRVRSEEHTSELQSRENLVCRLLLEKKKKTK